jgi:4-diphosphocytidyl-2-C-methyl-D-erythritol kinase
MQIRETARAKVNLTLAVLGRRADGYHDLESLVTFADVADRVRLTPGRDCRIAVSGPFAHAITGANLLETALALLREADPGLVLGAVELEKHLPVAAGLGGGSADAAALLRAVRSANPEREGAVAWHALAARLGADVPVCLAGRPALIRGIGDRIEPSPGAAGPPPIAAVLVNPRVPLPTARVFQALGARGAAGRGMPPTPRDAFRDLGALVGYMRAVGNDLEQPAISLLPVVAQMKAALAAQDGCLVAAMSGSGPTCFGLFAADAPATRGAAALAGAHPDWWVVHTRLDWPA